MTYKRVTTRINHVHRNIQRRQEDTPKGQVDWPMMHLVTAENIKEAVSLE